MGTERWVMERDWERAFVMHVDTALGACPGVCEPSLFNLEELSLTVLDY